MLRAIHYYGITEALSWCSNFFFRWSKRGVSWHSVKDTRFLLKTNGYDGVKKQSTYGRSPLLLLITYRALKQPQRQLGSACTLLNDTTGADNAIHLMAVLLLERDESIGRITQVAPFLIIVLSCSSCDMSQVSSEANVGDFGVVPHRKGSTSLSFMGASPHTPDARFARVYVKCL